MVDEGRVSRRSIADRVGRLEAAVAIGYTEVDDEIVLAQLERLDDLRAFVAQVSGWLLRR